ncbi:CBU_0592 family membrane protein [Lutimonas sp.]|uniref:CBU_0592 family membrane protein n=1 Tax=Lutimonas sp. TaxID=1872403 RepID=UPI003D9AFDA1
MFLGLEIVDWIGFVGVFQILLAYILNVRNLVKKGDLSFILLNLTGASLACLASYMMNYWPFILLEGIWAFVSLLALFSYFKKV